MANSFLKGGNDTGHNGFNVRTCATGSSNVLCEDKPQHRHGDAWPTHSNSSSSHSGTAVASHNTSVYANDKLKIVVGDSISCGGTTVGGANTYRIGG